MNNFNLIQEHFTQLHCSNCDLSFTKESIDLIREEKDYWVVKVCCTNCNHSPGFAIVGIESMTNNVHNETINLSIKNSIDDYIFDESVFKHQPQITEDEVIDAHNFIKNLGDDWMKYIKKPQS